jgi:two-component sensor histidine kinase
VSNSQAERRLNLEWLESGGPAVEQPARRGFGTTLLEKVVAVQCQAEVHLNYQPEGVRFAMALPLRDTRLVPAY